MASSSTGTSRSKPTQSCLLSTVPLVELHGIRVAIKRKNLPGIPCPGPMERSIDDPKLIIPIIHYHKGRWDRAVFDHPNVAVNQYDERMVIIQELPNRRSLERHRSRSASRNSRSPNCYRARSTSSEDSIRSVDPSRNVFNRKDDRNKERTRGRSTDRSLENERNRQAKKYGLKRGREEEEYKARSRKRSITPLRPGEYRPAHPDFEKRYKKQSPDRDYEKHRYARSRSYSKDRDRSRVRKSPSPDYHGSAVLRRSRSPGRSRYGMISKSPRRRSRSRTPLKAYYAEHKRLVSPSGRSSRKSRSPPHYRGSPRRYSSRMYSRSPGRRRSRSRSPRKSSKSLNVTETPEYAYYEGMPGAEYWMPGPIRPGFPVPRFYPPGFYHRGIPGAPMMVPRMPIISPFAAPFRQRMPIYNSRQNIKSPPTATVTSSSTAEKGATNESSKPSESSEKEESKMEGKKEGDNPDGLHEKD